MTEKPAIATPAAHPPSRLSIPSAWWEDSVAARSVRRWGLPVVALAVVVAGQLVEDLNDGSPLHLLAPPFAVRRWALIALVLYGVLVSGYVQATIRRSLAALRPVLKVSGEQFAPYELACRTLSWRIEAALLLTSAAIVWVVFVILRVSPLSDDPSSSQFAGLPTDAAAQLIVLGGYTFLGWAGLRLGFLTIRLARMLGRLSHEPLEINVFNTVDLLPFGNLALAIALAPAGVAAILFIGLGAPSTIQGWTVLILFTLAALLGLLLPLLGIHRQMSAARDAALLALDRRTYRLYEDTLAEPANAAEDDLARLRDLASTLLPLRNQVAQMTTWPFRNTAGLARAMLIVSAPLIYTALNQLITITIERLVP